MRSSGTMAMPWRMASCGERMRAGRPRTRSRAAVGRLGAEDGPQQLGATAPDKAGDAHDLARVDVEADVRAAASCVRGRDRQDRRLLTSVREWAKTWSTSRPTMARMMASVERSAAGTRERMLRPSRSTVTDVAISATSSRRCVTKMKPMPRSTSDRTRLKVRRTSCGERAEVGSSRMMRRASSAMALAISTSCCWHDRQRPDLGPRGDEAADADAIEELADPAVDAAQVEQPAEAVGAVLVDEDVLRHRSGPG